MKRACVIGWPVEHSRSPLIHNYWLKLHGIDGSYEKEAVPPGEAEAFLRSLAERGYVGANVTLPHKLAALKSADIADEAAYAIGAANTLWLDQAGRLNATNTDALGFMTNLEAQAPRWNLGRRPVLVIGAGGAARAILYGLHKGGAAKLLLANRTRDKAETLTGSFGPMSETRDWIEVVDWKERNRAVADCGLLVNTTSLGMTGQAPLDIDLAGLPADAVVADIVYAPLVTPLLTAAKNRGRTTVDGLGMLLHQAVPGFERWFGVRPEVTPELRAHVASSLGDK
ncbi:MAG: shikimate dehydrogenase [Methyloceanibacter sp.]|uniref:shikimate dehydrogenase n=1 Tax=Methyloceanibacter sp. TaxID=1965321 RepID=UPI003D9B0252